MSHGVGIKSGIQGGHAKTRPGSARRGLTRVGEVKQHAIMATKNGCSTGRHVVLVIMTVTVTVTVTCMLESHRRKEVSYQRDTP
jgi:hypothetical protein